MFRRVVILFTIYSPVHATAAPVVVRHDPAINRTLGFCARFKENYNIDSSEHCHLFLCHIVGDTWPVVLAAVLTDRLPHA